MKNNRQPPISDDHLLRQVASGDKQAFLLLYDRYRERLFTYCCRMIGDRERAKDAMQEALLKAYQNAGMYQEGTNVAAWLFRLTRNVCIDMLRARKEHDPIDDLQLPVQERAPDVMLQEALTEEIERLPEIYREAVVLRDVQGHSYDEIAKNVPIRRAGRPEEIASAVLWLCSPGASYVVGHALTVDGGMTVV